MSARTTYDRASAQVAGREGKVSASHIGASVQCVCPSGEFGFHKLECLRRGQSSPDTTELFYAHMEADRNAAESAYFDARKLLDCDNNRVLFRAGYERAYRRLWDAVVRGGL